MSPSKPALVLLLWAVALLLSALLVAAGEHWPEPLQPKAVPVLLLLLVPPCITALWLISGWRIGPPHPDRGESGNCAQGER